MQLLVSVRSGSEAASALAGGADIIDAKEPDRGSLGPVTPAVLAEIQKRIPRTHPLSVALGDLASIAAVRSAVASLPLTARAAPLYLKIGSAGIASPVQVGTLLSEAVETASRHPAIPRIIAVAYADASLACSVPPGALCRAAQDAGAYGVLIDTHSKTGRGLLGWLSPVELGTLVAKTRLGGLLVALAGEIGLANLGAFGSIPADIIGVRGAVCDNGRAGEVRTERVRDLRRRLDYWSSASFQGAVQPNL